MDKNFSSHADNSKLESYINKTFHTDLDVLRKIAENTSKQGLPPIQISPWDARHLQVLLRTTDAKKVVEFGTLGGYSATAMALAMPQDGRIYTFELSQKHATLAKENFKMAGVESQIEVLVGSAAEKMLTISDKGPFDFAFIDADKAGYVRYFEWVAERLKIGGVIAADNTLAWGKAVEENLPSTDEDFKSVQSLRAYNTYVGQRSDFITTLLPTGEGLTVSVKIK